MSVSDTINSIASHLTEAYDAVAEMGGESPANKNLANLAAAVDSIATGPAVPTSLAQLKQMVDAGREIVIGTEIPDTYAGNSNPLIVAQNLNSTNNADYGGAEGVILVRKFVDPTNQTFGSSADYTTSAIKNFLDTTYFENCSESLKTVISDISVQYYNGSSKTTVASKLFLMSAYEVCCQGNYGAAGYEGIMFDLWKERTGLSSPSSMGANNAGRKMKDRNGTALYTWVRSIGSASSNYAMNVSPNGALQVRPPHQSAGVLPACFVAKGGS